MFTRRAASCKLYGVQRCVQINYFLTHLLLRRQLREAGEDALLVHAEGFVARRRGVSTRAAEGGGLAVDLIVLRVG
jgi:hypothetical protein